MCTYILKFRTCFSNLCPPSSCPSLPLPCPISGWRTGTCLTDLGTRNHPWNLCSVPLTKQGTSQSRWYNTCLLNQQQPQSFYGHTEWTQTAQNRAWPRKKGKQKKRKGVKECKEQSCVFLSLFRQVLHVKLPHPCEELLLFCVKQR